MTGVPDLLGTCQRRGRGRGSSSLYYYSHYQLMVAVLIEPSGLLSVPLYHASGLPYIFR